MRKKFVALALAAVFVFVLSGCDMIRTVQGPDLEKPIFVKQLVYTDDMDLELDYICNDDWEKTIDKVEIPNAPKGVDCRVENEEDYYDGKYKVVTTYLSVRSDNLDDDGGIAEDLEISQLNITWNDGTTTTEDLGNITITSDALDFDTVDESGGSDYGEDYYSFEPVKRKTEITGVELPTKEVMKLVDEIYINDRPLDEISFTNPLTLESGESCDLTIMVDDSLPEYGVVDVAGKVMKKSGNKEVKYTNFFVRKGLFEYGDVTEYLKAVLK